MSCWVRIPRSATLAAIIAERAAGNPFFAEEMVRELVQRGVLTGERGGYICRADVADASAVPATVQAAIEARIDRLSTPAKRTLNAASVIGARFGAELLAALGIDPVFDELLDAELIDQVRFTPSAEYAFRHPLIRAVAYESQLKSDRAQCAPAAGRRDRISASPESADQNAALIAEHLQAAGDLHAAYGWHMRAATWSTHRDIAAARVELGAGPPDRRRAARRRPRPRRDAHRPAHHAVRRPPGESMQHRRRRFEELRELCAAAGDKASLAIAHGRHGDGSHVCMAACARRRGWHPNRWRCSSRSAIRP